MIWGALIRGSKAHRPGVRRRIAGGSASAAAARLPAPGVLAYADEEPVSCEADAEAEVFLAIGTGDHRWAGGGW